MASLQAHLGPGRDWVALMVYRPVHAHHSPAEQKKEAEMPWRFEFIQGYGSATVRLKPDSFYRAFINHVSYSIYVGVDGELNYLESREFHHELFRRFKDGEKAVLPQITDEAIDRLFGVPNPSPTKYD